MRIAKYMLRFAAIVLGLSLVFAWLGVYGTSSLPFGHRLFFWAATMTAGAASSELLIPIIWSKRFEHWTAPLKIGVLAATISVPVTVVLIWLNNGPIGLRGIATQYGYVLVISLIISTGMYVVEALKTKTADPDTGSDPQRTFMDRLPVKYRTAELYAIASEDHYLRVYTSLGSDLILMRLADAVRELSGADGLQVHRSWWVARSAINDEKRENGRSFLVLPDGTEVPVSRSYRAKAKEAGLVA